MQTVKHAVTSALCGLLLSAGQAYALNCGYVDAPCNEAAFKHCIEDTTTKLHCENHACEAIGPAIISACACDNMTNKADRAKEEVCEGVITPAEFVSSLENALPASQ